LARSSCDHHLAILPRRFSRTSILTQRGDSRGCHRQLLPWMRLRTLNPQDRAFPPLPTISPC
jgi:hypothetical protein